MKISKLFHWLYAVLMLLPVFAIGVTCAYVIFNKNAYQSNNDYEIQDTIQVTTSNNLLIENRDYIWTFTGNYPQQTDYVYFNNISEWVTNLMPNYTIIAFRFTGTSNFVLRDNNNIDHAWYGYFTNNTNKSFNFNYQTTNGTASLINSGKLLLIDYKKGTLDNVFYYSIDKVQESPLFNWAYDSFLATPITYITGLFGMANDNIAVMFMSYWLAISVIWLVFDMVMYVPLLVHRWIDKGVLE